MSIAARIGGQLDAERQHRKRLRALVLEARRDQDSLHRDKRLLRHQPQHYADPLFHRPCSRPLATAPVPRLVREVDTGSPLSAVWTAAALAGGLVMCAVLGAWATLLWLAVWRAL